MNMKVDLKNSCQILAGSIAMIHSTVISAQTSADILAKELANPNTALASLNFKSTYTSYVGDLPGANDESGFTTLFQPVLPFPLDNGDKIIFRPAVPLIGSAPAFDGANLNWDSESGLGDIGFDLIYARTSESGTLSGVGLVGSLGVFQ